MGCIEVGVDFYGYTIYSDGTIISQRGKPMAITVDKNNVRMVRLYIDGKRKHFIVSRLIYCVFNGLDILSLSRDKCVSYRDGNKSNVELSNLYLISRKDLIQGENNTSSKLNNRDVKCMINEFNSLRDSHISMDYIKDYLSSKYGVKKETVMHIVKGRARNKDNYKL